MEYSGNGTPILHGQGVAAVRKKIEDAFRGVRTTARIDTAETSEKRIETFDLEETEVEGLK